MKTRKKHDSESLSTLTQKQISPRQTHNKTPRNQSGTPAFQYTNDPEYFIPPEKGTIGRSLYDSIHPLVLNYEHHITNVQHFFGLPTKTEVLKGKPAVSKYPGVDLIMYTASGLGNELFYGLWAVISGLILDPEVGQCLMMLWVVTMYIGQIAKDIGRLPRPGLQPGSEVLRLDTHYAAEYGFPSTHTGSASCQPLALLYYVYTKYDFSSSHHSPLMLTLVTLFCFFWFFITPLSRLYLGVHSSIDLVGGYLIGLGCLVPIILFQSYYNFFVHSPLCLFAIISVVILALTFYPRPKDHWTSSPGDTAVAVGAGTGVLAGHVMSNIFGVSLLPFRVVTMPTSILGMITAILHIPVALAFAYAIRVILKPVLKIVSEILYDIIHPIAQTEAYESKKKTKEGQKPETATERQYREVAKRFFMELCDKGTGYFVMSFLVPFIFPFLTEWIGWTYELPLLD